MIRPFFSTISVAIPPAMWYAFLSSINCIWPDDVFRIRLKLEAEGTLENLIELSAEGARSQAGRISQANRRRQRTFHMSISPEPLFFSCSFLFPLLDKKTTAPDPGGHRAEFLVCSRPGKDPPGMRGQESRNSDKKGEYGNGSVSVYSVPHPRQETEWFADRTGSESA